MNASLRGTGRQYWVALRALLIFTVVLGIAYPLVVTGVGQLVASAQANGSTVTSGGKVVGSALIGQGFVDKKGNPLPQWFQSRPSAAGNGWDAGASSGSNLGPNNPDLLKSIEQRKKTIEMVDGVAAGSIPADAVTASGSGLDPHISPEFALLQVDAVAKARGIDADKVRALVQSHIQQRDLGYLGEATVNVLQLNIALAELDPSGNE
ncbi:K(+)-transporting ATPase subunit C [Leifsonia virtsii]|uniref:Potassium-transporting ATPase KdpC subunit n=1 Tax=Leifsonia virtsii TaxID=3035915 RepID=A0ABT8IVL8_9MICO|nr:K(+)-transporting ATPase subunit C [Leifsonia virtsii]MDN4596846.1 K(+)-transporting ATPase subunit C [Leifsonia virtsii]